MKDYLKSYIQSPTFSPEVLREAIRTERAERHLSEFIKQAWDVIEPGTTYVHNWHTDLISEYLQAVRDGEIRRLIINIPPRHMKSIQVTVCFPVWTWIRNPEKRFIKVSYSDTLSRKHNILARDIIRSPWYQKRWGNRFSLKDDMNQQAYFKNNFQGFMFSTSTGGSLTGEGGDIIILDDPQNPQMANSEAEREATISFFQNTLQTRLNDPEKGVFIIIMQRLHDKDLTGHILEEKLGYEHLCLPAIAEEKTIIYFPKSHKQVIRNEGDLLNAERFSKETLENLKKSMGSEQFSGQFQQRPAPAEGLIFKRAWMNNFYKQLPRMSMQIQSWDMPFKDTNGSAKCAGIVMGRAGADIYIIDMINDKMEFTASVAAVRMMKGKHPKARAIVVEDKANGPAVVSFLRKEVPGMVEFTPKGSKEERAISVTPYFEAGNIYFPDPSIAPWVKDLIEDLLRFPKARYKDTVDALVQGILYLYDKPITSGPPTDTTLTKESYWKK